MDQYDPTILEPDNKIYKKIIINIKYNKIKYSLSTRRGDTDNPA